MFVQNNSLGLLFNEQQLPATACYRWRRTKNSLFSSNCSFMFVVIISIMIIELSKRQTERFTYISHIKRKRGKRQRARNKRKRQTTIEGKPVRSTSQFVQSATEHCVVESRLLGLVCLFAVHSLTHTHTNTPPFCAYATI